MRNLILLVGLTLCGHGVFAQGAIEGLLRQSSNEPVIGCGSHELIKNVDLIEPGFKSASDLLIQEIVRNSEAQHKTTQDSILRIPVVFHVLYNSAEENLADSVIYNQLHILNDSFRRNNADTSSMRAVFKDIVGDTKIEFYLANFDPQGNPTNGIVRKSTSVAYFGGVLPYAANQTAQIQQWVNDSLYYNIFRLANDSLGGSDAWDINYYLNFWIGDLRILEPKLNNFEELVFFALATPPLGHANWPTLPYDIVKNQGVLIHYVNVGANNPVKFVGPYAPYNGLVTGGKILVHEVGHYLGLRHIWGDGPCAVDDFVHDTPRGNNSSQFLCDSTLNSCVDTINGVDLPNMIENYMDYSSGQCQNSFTQGQINLMRTVLATYRGQLFMSLKESSFAPNISFYPNPTEGKFTIVAQQNLTDVALTLFDLSGRQTALPFSVVGQNLEVELSVNPGMYFIRISAAQGEATIKVIVK